MQEDRLWIADPKAINHILQKSGYLYPKPNLVREGSALVAGHGIVWAEGEFPIVTDPFFQPYSRSGKPCHRRLFFRVT